MDQKYEILLQNPDLYSSHNIEYFGLGKHWSMSTWKQRERSMAHDMVCLYLCNLKTVDNAPQLFLSDYLSKERKRKREMELQNILDEEPPAKKRAAEREDYGSDEEYFDDGDSESQEEFSEEDNEEEYMPGQKLFRYKLLEGLPAASTAQNTYAEKWGIERPKKLYDIIDVKEQKFIEVKFTMNFEKRKEEYLENGEDNQNTSLILVHPETAEVFTLNKRDEMPGISKVTLFVTRRKEEMINLGLSQSEIDEHMDLDNFIFTNEKINDWLSKYREFYLRDTTGTITGKKRADLTNDLHNMDPKTMFENMTQSHLLGDYPEITWDGKILPSCWKNHIKAYERDDESIDAFMNLLVDDGVTKIEGDQSHWEFLKTIRDKWDTLNGSGRQFSLYETSTVKRRAGIPDIVKDMLGIEKKKRIRGDMEGMRQGEYALLGPRKYSNWFDELYEDLGKRHPYHREYTFTMENENPDRVAFHRKLHDMISLLNKSIAASNVGVFISEYTNVFSRLSGAYMAGATGSGSHSRVIICPITCNFTLTSSHPPTLNRRMSGIIVRGPNHSRSMSDRINISSVEIVNDKFQPKFVKNYCLIHFASGTRILIRKNAYKKIDGPYLSYIRNSLFSPANLLGEIVTKAMAEENTMNIEPILLELHQSERHRQFYIDRVIDGALMAAIGNSRDEGYFSMLRKIFMVLIAARRGDKTLSFDVSNFCAAINENIVDNPLSMFFHNSILFALSTYF